MGASSTQTECPELLGSVCDSLPGESFSPCYATEGFGLIGIYIFCGRWAFWILDLGSVGEHDFQAVAGDHFGLCSALLSSIVSLTFSSSVGVLVRLHWIPSEQLESSALFSPFFDESLWRSLRYRGEVDRYCSLTRLFNHSWKYDGSGQGIISVTLNEICAFSSPLGIFDSSVS